MEAEVKCTEADCTGKKECGDYCIICFILNEDPIEDSPRPDEGNSEKTGDMLAKNETLAAVSVAVDEPQVEHNARQVLRANKNVVFAKANGLPPEHPKIFEQEITSVGFSNFGVCPASEGISERQSVAVQDKITDSTVESAGSVSRIEPEPSTSGYSGQKRKRNANTDSVEAKKNSRANERKANASQDGKRLKEGVCQVCNDRKYGNIYAHLKIHENRAQKSEDQNEKNYTHMIELKNGEKTLVRVLKTDGHKKKPVKMYDCDICAQYSTYSKNLFKKHFERKHFTDGEKRIKCNHCPKSFAGETILNEHVYNCHTFRWECHVCNQNMTYNQKSNHEHPVSKIGKNKIPTSKGVS